MRSDLESIVSTLKGLSRRQRLVSAVRTGLLLFAGSLVALLAAMACAAMGVDRIATRWSTLTPLAFVLLGGLVWVLRGWRRAGAQAQALRLEGLLPELRGRLLTVISRQDGPRPQESEDLLALAARKSLAEVSTVSTRQVHPARFGRFLLPPAMLGMVLLCAGVFAPMGPLDTLRWLAGSAVPPVQAAADDPEAPVITVLLGDLSLTYHYPEYTGLPPLEVPNSTGEAHAPPGTTVVVRAKTVDRFDVASLQVDELPPQAGTVREGRLLEGSFDVGAEDGLYRFLLQRGAEAARSPDFPILVEPDTAPVVDVDAPADRFEVGVDDPIPVSWAVRDDYGVLKVELEVGRTRKLLQELPGHRQAQGVLDMTPADLGLSPGAEVSLIVVGWDNDEANGSKEGRSRRLRMKVLGEEQERLRQQQFRRELRDALVDVLAPFVTDDQPVAQDRGGMLRWSQEASRRFDPLEGLIEEFWDGFSQSSLEGRIIEEVQREGTSLLLYSQQLGEAGSTEPVDPRDQQILAEKHEQVVALLETYVLMLDRIVRYRALVELRARAEDLEKRSNTFAARAAGGAEAPELSRRLDELDQTNEALRQAGLDFDGGRMSELVGRWSEDLDHMSEYLHQLLEQGDMERARVVAGWYAEETTRLANALRAMQQQQEEATEDERNMLQELIEELERIEREERALATATQEAREAEGTGGVALDSRWEEIEDHARRAVEEASASRDSVVGSGARGREAEQARRSVEYAERLLAAAAARDLPGALQEANTAGLNMSLATSTMASEDRHRKNRGQQPQRASAIRDMQDAERAVEDAYELLAELNRDVNLSSPEMREAVREQLPEQTELESDTRATQEPAARVASMLPMGAPGLEENIDAGVREMGRAGTALEDGWAYDAQMAEEAAADRILLALEALAQAAAGMSEMSDAMGGAGGQGGGQGSGEEGGGGVTGENPKPYMDMPDPNDFPTPEEYRQALMEGMQGDVPPEYEALKARYYEELVRQ